MHAARTCDERKELIRREYKREKGERAFALFTREFHRLGFSASLNGDSHEPEAAVSGPRGEATPPPARPSGKAVETAAVDALEDVDRQPKDPASAFRGHAHAARRVGEKKMAVRPCCPASPERTHPHRLSQSARTRRAAAQDVLSRPQRQGPVEYPRGGREASDVHEVALPVPQPPSAALPVARASDMSHPTDRRSSGPSPAPPSEPPALAIHEVDRAQAEKNSAQPHSGILSRNLRVSTRPMTATIPMNRYLYMFSIATLLKNSELPIATSPFSLNIEHLGKIDSVFPAKSRLVFRANVLSFSKGIRVGRRHRRGN